MSNNTLLWCILLVIGLIWFFGRTMQQTAAERSIPTAGLMANPVPGKWWR